MDIEKIFVEIQNLNNLIYRINKRDKDALNEMNRLHKIVFGTKINEGCSNCHIKAFNKLLSLTYQDLQEMENQNFKIKPDALIEHPAGSGQFYSAANGIDDKTAFEILTGNPKLLKHFESYPKDEAGKLSGSISSVDLSKLNKEKLQAVYKKEFGEDADESLTKAQLVEAIEAK